MCNENTTLLANIRVKHAVEQLSSKSIQIARKYLFGAFLISIVYRLELKDPTGQI
jgi:hypothetical protein